MKAFTKSTERFEISPSLLRDVRQKRPEGRVKKKSEQKNPQKKVSFKDSLLSFKSVSCVSQYTRETERPKKTSKPRDRARKEATTSGDIFSWSKKRDASLSEFWDVLARKVWITLFLRHHHHHHSRALKSNRERSPFSSRRRRRRRQKKSLRRENDEAKE